MNIGNLLKRIINKWGLYIVFIITFLSFITNYSGFFQQDEWFAFGKLYSESSNGLFTNILLYFKADVGHYTPLFRIVFLIFYDLFDLKYKYWFLESILWHIFNTYLVYLLSIQLFDKKEKIRALAVSLLFGISASSYQATSWVGANMNTHGATTFALISMIFFFKYQDSSDFRRWFKSIIFLFISLMFKELAVGLFAVYAIVLYLNRNQNKKLLSTLFSGMIYVVIRGIMFILPQAEVSSVATQTQSLGLIIRNMITYPAKTLVQILIPQKVFIDVGYFIGRVLPDNWIGEPNTRSFDIFVQTNLLEVLSIIVFLVISFLIYRQYKKSHKQVLLISYLFIIFNSFIYALSPERMGIISIIDSRNLYFIVIGVFLMSVTLIYDILFSHIRIITAMVISLIFVNIFFLEKELVKVTDSGKLRRNVLNQIQVKYPTLSSQAVFYTDSDSAYYGLPDSEKILPFQSGFGHTLMVYYAKDENLPSEFFDDRFLWEITDQGYKQVNGRGFGYFRDFNMLMQAINEYNIPKEGVIGFSWKSGVDGLSDITDDLRERITNDEMAKK